VVSCISYATQVYTYKASQLPLRIQVQMALKAEELQAVVVEPYEKDGWEKWGKFFTENFIGTSENAQGCTIKNYAVLHFRHSRKRNELTVVADEPLVIENKALGYTITYQLEAFSFDFNKTILLFYGYTLFADLTKKGPKAWQLKNRQQAYNGSITHFMRSVYHNRLAEDGFEVKRLFKTPNLEKERVKKLYRENLAAKKGVKDSSDYYNSVFRQPDMLERYGTAFLTADSLVTPVDSITKSIFFTDYLYIVFKKEKEEQAYLTYTRENRQPYFQRSVLLLLNGNALRVDGMGNYYMPQDLISYGYWGWSEKVSSMLPLDYKSE